MRSTPLPPGFDPLQIEFPSDKITLGSIRKREVKQYADGQLLAHAETSNIDAFVLHQLEVFFAAKAFAKAAGQPEPFPEWSSHDLRASIVEGHAEYSLSAGRRASLELLRRIETDAAAQAQRDPKERPTTTPIP